MVFIPPKKIYEERPENDLKLHPHCDINIPLVKRKFWWGIKADATKLEAMKQPHSQVCFVPTESTACETTEECLKFVPEIQKRNMKFRDWPDIPFNFLIGGDGNIYEGRGWMMKYKDHGNPAMHETLQIGYIGHYKDCDPPKEMVDLGSQLIDYGIKRKFITEDYKYMECPLTEYYQYPPDVFTFWESPEYKEFLKTVPPPPPPIPPASGPQPT